MILRSIDKLRLKCTLYVGDGDESSYGVVAGAVFQKYRGSYLVLKEDCPIQKRMGNNLRTYKRNSKSSKLADASTEGEKGRLTDGVINSLQNYHGFAIRENSNKLQRSRKLCGQSMIMLYSGRMRILQFNPNSVQEAMIADASIIIDVCLLFLEMNCCQYSKYYQELIFWTGV